MDSIRLTAVIEISGTRLLPTEKYGQEGEEAIRSLAVASDRSGADAILILDRSVTDEEKAAANDACRSLDGLLRAPLILSGSAKRFEDIKKFFYTGADEVWVDGSRPGAPQAYAEAKERFSQKKLFCTASIPSPFDASREGIAEALGNAFRQREQADNTAENPPVSFSVPVPAPNEARELPLIPEVSALLVRADTGLDFHQLRLSLKEEGIPMLLKEPEIPWEALKKDAAGLVPCIVQDYLTGEVLMMAYMDEAAYLETVRGGRMCYFSRSRQSRWLKGETSGHYQYLRSLQADCDLDTLLAGVEQIGAACHTGSRSCFFNKVSGREDGAKNPRTILEDIETVAKERRLHPKEGSYTNYLFDKGIDKILKKCGEEAAEIIIAAKNPDAQELRYEIADFMYHVTVLMVEKGVTWEDVARELANR